MATLDNLQKERLLAWYRAEGRHDLLWRKLQTPWAIFVAESLLRRTKASSVAEIYPRIIEEFTGPSDVIMQQSRWQKMTAGLGLASRAHKFFEACHQLVDLHRNQVPAKYSDLISLPGVGHYIANAVLCFGYHQPEYIIDTNTLRIAARVSGSDIKQAQHRSRKAKQLLVECFGEQGGLSPELNYALLDLAFLICRPSNPICEICPLADSCHYRLLELS